MKPYRWFVAVSVFVLLSAVASSAATPEERATALTVLVETSHGEGTGIIFHRDGDTVYIMTASHVVETSPSTRDRTANVFFNRARSQPFSATVAPQQSNSFDLAVLKVTAPARVVGDLDFRALGDENRRAKGNQVYPLGHLNPRLRWWHPATPVLLSRVLGDQLTFETGTSKMTGFSGGGLFDSEWGLIGMIVEDSPPETFALSIRAVLDQLRRWQYEVSLHGGTAGIRDSQTVVTPGGTSFGTGNVIYTPPLGWVALEQPDGSIVLKKPDASFSIIMILPGTALTRRFEDMFDEGVRSIPPISLTSRPTTQRAQEGFNYRFVEGVTQVNMGGLTKPTMVPMNFLYMGFDPVGRYESVIYMSTRYVFEVDRPLFDEFLRSLDFRNAAAARDAARSR
jgi:hypothetical protein